MSNTSLTLQYPHNSYAGENSASRLYLSTALCFFSSPCAFAARSVLALFHTSPFNKTGRSIRDRLGRVWYGIRKHLDADSFISGLTLVVVVLSFVFFFTSRPSPEMDAEQRRLMMKTVVGVLFLIVLAPVVGLTGCIVLYAGGVPVRFYVASAGSDANSGRKISRPLETLNAALTKAALTRRGGGPVEIVLLGEVDQALTVENCPPIVLHGDSSLGTGILAGTITVGPGGDLTLGKDVVVTGPGRGVQVLGGTFTLDGGAL
jgi:hypothetical protein